MGKPLTQEAQQSNRIGVFIDAGNLWGVYKSIGKMVDFAKLTPFLERIFSGHVFRVYYYVAYPATGTRPKEELDRLHRFLTFLKKGLNFVVIKKQLKTINLRNKEGHLIYNQKTGNPETIEKGNLDIELAIDAIRFSSGYDTAILITGDSDFLPVVTYLKKSGNPKKVYIFSTEGNISHELKTGGDGYFDLKEYPELFRGSLGQSIKKT